MIYRDKQNHHLVIRLETNQRITDTTRFENVDAESYRCVKFLRTDTNRIWLMDEDEFLNKYEEIKELQIEGDEDESLYKV